MNAAAFNAAMYPNGVMLVWTGLLLRVEDAPSGQTSCSAMFSP